MRDMTGKRKLKVGYRVRVFPPKVEGIYNVKPYSGAIVKIEEDVLTIRSTRDHLRMTAATNCKVIPRR